MHEDLLQVTEIMDAILEDPQYKVGLQSDGWKSWFVDKWKPKGVCTQICTYIWRVI